MKKLSKLTALVLALAMAFALASCGGNSASTTGSASKSEAPAASASGSGDKSAADASDAESDLQYVKDKGTLVVGITDFEPMDYKDDSGEWIGFDADMAKRLCREPGRAGRVRRDQLGQQDPGAGQQDHRLRLERHDPDG